MIYHFIMSEINSVLTSFDSIHHLAHPTPTPSHPPSVDITFHSLY